MPSFRRESPPPSRRQATWGNAAGVGDEFRTIAEAMPQLVWTTRPDGEVDYVNRRWIEYTGVDIEEFARRGKDVGVVHPDELEQTWALWNDALKSGEPFEQEYRLRRASDSSYRWFLCRAVPVRDEKGAISRWIGTATDIDERQRARDSLRFVSEVGNVVSIASDVDGICRALADVAVGYFADFCVVTLFENGAHVTAARNQKKTPDLERVEVQSEIRVPLVSAHGEVIGAVSFVSAQPGHIFNETDLEVARVAAARTATAIANVRVLESQRRAATQLRFTGRINRLLFESADPWKAMERVAAMIARDVADACAVLRLDGDAVRTEILVHRNRRTNAAIAALRGRRVLRLKYEAALATRLRDHETIVATGKQAASFKQRAWPYLAREIEALGARSSVVVPWRDGAATHGALVAYYSGRPFDPRDVALLEEIAARASVAMERALTLERERKIATTLQQASLPSLIPQPEGLRFDAVYAPAGDEAAVGGDWYDAIELDDKSVVVSVGDVTGRGIQAAAIMSKVRHGMGMTPLHETDPTKILDSAEWFLGKRYSDAIVTAFVAVISADRRSVRFANAGHPLPILRRGSALQELKAYGLPLGLRKLAPSDSSRRLELHDGDILVLFTDGLIETQREWEIGESRLREVITSGLFAASTAPAKLIARSCLPSEVRDDVAILTVGVGKPPAWSLALDDARAAIDARAQFVQFLKSISRDRNFIDKAELVFGELLGNVVRHAPGPVEVSVEVKDGSIVLHVIDSGPPLGNFQRALPDDVLSECGRGLFIVEHLTASVRAEHVRDCGNHLSVTLSYRTMPSGSRRAPSVTR